MISPDHIKVAVQIGETTCMGVNLNRELPYRHGNRFAIMVKDPTHDVVARVLNMTAENLEAAENRFLTDRRVWISLWSEDDRHWALIDDGRIPRDWYEDRLRWTGCGKPSIGMAEAIYRAHGGDEYGEMLQFTDPQRYWQDRGWRYLDTGSAYMLLDMK